MDSNILYAFPRGYVRTGLHNFEMSLRVGIHPWERERPQKVRISVEMFADDPGRPPDKGISSVVDYDHIYNALMSWRDRQHVDLLETLVEELVVLCFDNSRVKACRVSILKIDIFPQAEAAGVEIFRVRD